MSDNSQQIKQNKCLGASEDWNLIFLNDPAATKKPYMVDWYQFQGILRWSLILFFMFF